MRISLLDRDGATTRRRRLRSFPAAVALLLTSAGAVLAITAPAVAVDTTPQVMATTQRMTGPHLANYYQHGTYPAGTSVTLSCYERGQAVKGYYSPWIPGQYDDLWYQTTDGHWIADVDINTGSNGPVVGSCVQSLDTNQWYEVVAKHSGKAVDVAGAGTANGTRLQQYTRNNSSAQRFRVESTGDGYYRFVTRVSGTKVWDVSGGGTANGTKMQVYSSNGTNAQQFLVHRVATGGYRLTPRNATNRCLDVPGASTSNSVQLQIWTCNAATNQSFDLRATGAATADGRNGWSYPIRPHGTLTTYSGHDGSVVDGWAFGSDDIAASEGTPIYAMKGGTATTRSITVGSWCPAGVPISGQQKEVHVTSVVNGVTYRFIYAHLSSFASIGSNVSEGQVIGYVGHSGCATGNHLHIGVSKAGSIIHARDLLGTTQY